LEKTAIVIGSGISGLCTAALLVKQGVNVKIFEKNNFVGGRTKSTIFRGHILDNGFHIMPFYKTSAVYKVLSELNLLEQLPLAKVKNIVFFQNNKFHRYPKGIIDILRLSILPLKSRISLLKFLMPMAFSSIEKSESYDNVPLAQIIKSLDKNTKVFFDAICMLAFADTPEHISLGEFIRTIIRANPFKGGTSEFAYPDAGGYDSICKILDRFICENGGKVYLNKSIKKIEIINNKVQGVITSTGTHIAGDAVIVSYPAYLAINELFDKGVFISEFVQNINRLNKTTSVIETHFCLSKKIDTRQVVFPVGSNFVTKGIFFVSNISPSVSPIGEQLIMAGTPVPPEYTENPSKIREITEKMKEEISSIYPEFHKYLLWDRPMAWKLVEAIVKEPGLVWKQKMPHEVGIDGLFFIGDSTISYGMGTDSAAHSSILCNQKILSFLRQDQNQNIFKLGGQISK